MGKIEDFLEDQKEKTRKRLNPTHKEEVAGLVKASMRNPNTNYYTNKGKQIGKKRKEERLAKQGREAEQEYADSKKTKRFEKLRSLASTEKKEK